MADVAGEQRFASLQISRPASPEHAIDREVLALVLALVLVPEAMLFNKQ